MLIHAHLCQFGEANCLLMVIEWFQQAEEAGVIYGEITPKVVCPGLSPVQEKWSYWKESRKGS